MRHETLGPAPSAYGTGQYVRVEHVHIGDGGQAVIGNVRARESDRDLRTAAICQEMSDNDAVGDTQLAQSYGSP